jgi:hypothetical protein
VVGIAEVCVHLGYLEFGAGRIAQQILDGRVFVRFAMGRMVAQRQAVGAPFGIAFRLECRDRRGDVAAREQDAPEPVRSR